MKKFYTYVNVYYNVIFPFINDFVFENYNRIDRCEHIIFVLSIHAVFKLAWTDQNANSISRVNERNE